MKHRISRAALVVFSLAVWSVIAAHLFLSVPAQSNTPFIDNVRRAINSCKVVGRLASEEQNGNSYVSFNSRLLCLNAGQQQNSSFPQR